MSRLRRPPRDPTRGCVLQAQPPRPRSGRPGRGAGRCVRSWLNDAVKGYLSPRGEYDPFLDLPNLRVFVARPEYLLAMKCAAMRLGAAFHDLDDVRYLLRYLNIEDAEEALAIVTRYFGEEHLPPKTRLALEELPLRRGTTLAAGSRSRDPPAAAPEDRRGHGANVRYYPSRIPPLPSTTVSTKLVLGMLLTPRARRTISQCASACSGMGTWM